MENYYEILGVSSTASRDEIKKRYHKLILESHPDKNKDSSNGRFHLIDEAWKILGNDASRKMYDAKLKVSQTKDDHPVHEEIFLMEMVFRPDCEEFEWDCRCGGKYVISEEDTFHAVVIADCDSCSLSIMINCCSVPVNSSARNGKS